MAEEAQEVESAPKAKSPLIKILVIVLAVVLLLVAAIGGTLFATGFFSKKEQLDPDQQIDHAVGADGKGKKSDCKAGGAWRQGGKSQTRLPQRASRQSGQEFT